MAAIGKRLHLRPKRSDEFCMDLYDQSENHLLRLPLMANGVWLMASPLRIMHISTRLILGGSQENSVLSCEGQVERGHQVSLVYGPIYGPEGSLLDRVHKHDRIETIETPHLVRAQPDASQDAVTQGGAFLRRRQLCSRRALLIPIRRGSIEEG